MTQLENHLTNNLKFPSEPDAVIPVMDGNGFQSETCARRMIPASTARTVGHSSGTLRK
jgi:hypothetical protein